MKFTLLIFLASVLLMGACKEGNVKLTVRQLQENDKTTHWEIQMNQPEFSSNVVNCQENCKVFNTFISYMVQRIRTNFIQNANEQIASLDSANIDYAPFVLNVSNNVLMDGPRYLSVRLNSYQMYHGAHGQTDIYGLNYDLEKQSFLKLADMMDLSKGKEINALLKKHLEDPDHCLTFAEPTVDNVTAVNITPKAIEFVYAQYILGPYSCGPVTIELPREELKGLLLLN